MSNTYVPQKYRPDIDGLRAIAVAVVVAYHAKLPFFSGGFVGVDIFFVISGYLITGLLMNEVNRTGRISLVSFFARRFRRLLPMASTVLVATAIMTWTTIAPIDYGVISNGMVAAALWFANWYFIGEAQNYFAPDVNTIPTLHFWSLSVEEQFYLLWPIILALSIGAKFSVAGRATKLFNGRLLIVLYIIVFSSFALSVSTRWTGGVWSYFGLHTRAWELGVGAVLAVWSVSLPKSSSGIASTLNVTGLVMIAFSVIAYSDRTPFPGIHATIPVVGAALVILSGTFSTTESILHHPIFVAIGKRSYSWYLWHWPFLIFVPLWCEILSKETNTFTPVTLAVFLSYMAADISYRSIEKPVRKSIALSNSHRLTYLMGLGLIGVSLLAAFGVKGPQPYSRSIAPIGSISTNGAETPEKARADIGSVNDHYSCHSRLTSARIDLNCVFGDPNGETSIALIGDSHARHWAPGLDRMAKVNGLKLWVWTKGACPIATVPVYQSDLKREYTECEAWRKNLMNGLKEIDNLALIVIGRTKRYGRNLISSTGERGKINEAAQLWEQGMEKTLLALSKFNADVVIIIDTPFSPRDVPSCLSKNKMDASTCSFKSTGQSALEKSFILSERTAYSNLKESGIKVPALTFIHPSQQLCNDETCEVVSPDGTIRFRDQEHLTATYTSQLADELATQIMSLLFD